MFATWLNVVPIAQAWHTLFLNNGRSAGHDSHAFDIVLKYLLYWQLKHCLKLWSQYCGKLHWIHFVPSLNGKYEGHTHFCTVLSQIKLELQVWTVGATGVGAIGVGATGVGITDVEAAQFVTFNWHALEPANH